MKNWKNLLPASQNKRKWLKKWKNQAVAEKRICTLSVD